MEKVQVLSSEFCAGRFQLAALVQVEKLSGLSAVKAALSCGNYDAAVLCACEDGSEKLSIELAKIATVILIGEFEASKRSVLSECGVITVPPGELSTAIYALRAMSARMQALEYHASDLQRKLDDTRIVNRAKLLLMSRLKMSEKEAHRYIEKAAMDGCLKRRDVAESILRTYEE